MRLILVSFLFLSFSLSAKPFKVGLVLDKGGRDDKSFNSAAYNGANDLQKKLGFDLKVVESSDDTALEPSLRTFAQHGYDLVIGIGFIMKTPIEKVAKQFPKTHFLIIDSLVALPNVRSVIFKEQEGSYLVGAIAALASKTKVVGFIGGMDIPLIRRFEMGYKAGILATQPKAQLITNYVGSSTDAWRNPTKGKELALSQISKKADVIFQAAGASGLGVFDAAEEKKVFAIGVDSNQNWVKPGKILTSMVKRVDLAVSTTIEESMKDQFKAGEFSVGLAEGMVDYSLDEHNRKILTPEIEKVANDLKKKIIEKKIIVPDYYETNKK